MDRAAPGAAFSIRVPYVTVRAGAALRLDAGLDGPGGAPEAASSDDDQLAGLHGRLARCCDQWRRGERLFLERYFDVVSRHVESHREALTEGLRRFGGVFRYTDWVYSALMPLPRAHLHAPESDEPFGPGTLIRVDFALWTGTAAIAIEIPGTGTRSPATDKRHDRLRRAGVRVVEISLDLLGAEHTAEFEAALPDDLRMFLRGRALPAGPLKPAALDVNLDEI